MTDSAVSVEQESPDDAVIARATADRRAGRDATRDVEELLRVAGQQNRAALDRLAR
jgi:hypothetical protein